MKKIRNIKYCCVILKFRDNSSIFTKITKVISSKKDTKTDNFFILMMMKQDHLQKEIF